MKCSPLFLTSPTVVWKESFRYMKFLDVLQTKFQSLNPLSGKESFRPYLIKQNPPHQHRS